jgi:hypothetical protein
MIELFYTSEFIFKGGRIPLLKKKQAREGYWSSCRSRFATEAAGKGNKDSELATNSQVSQQIKRLSQLRK